MPYTMPAVLWMEMRLFFASELRKASKPSGAVRNTHTSAIASMMAPPVSSERSLLRNRLRSTNGRNLIIALHLHRPAASP